MAGPLTPKQIWERALAGSRWLVDHQNHDGSWRGLRHPKVDAFYKSCWALSEAGQSAAAHRALSYIHRHFSTATGDFLCSKPDAANFLLGKFPYVNSYIIIGSMRAGRFEIAMPAMSFLLAHQAEDHGGFYSRLAQHEMKNISDTMTSSTAGIACLAAGKVKEAGRVADYLAHIIDLQPKPNDYFFTTIGEDGHLCTDVKNDDGDFMRIIDTKKPDQCWFAVGLPLSFLVSLASATNETKYLDLANWYFDFQQRCINPWDGYSSGKAGWGCAMLYRLTGEARYRDIASRVAKNIMDKQRTDGGWLSGWGKRSELVNADFDLTGEFTLWLSLIAANLFTRDSSRIPIVSNKKRIPRPKPTQPLRQLVVRTIKAHYRILRNEGFKEYLMYSYYYRKNQVMGWFKK